MTHSDDKPALITGGGRGIGRAVALQLPQRGALLAALGAGAIGAGHLLTAPPASASGRLTKGNAAILQFLAAAELLQADPSEPHKELGGIQDSERPGGGGGPGLDQGSLVLDKDIPQYIRDNAACGCTARAHTSGRRWRSTWMAEHITCQEVVELVTDYLERVLPADETSLFERHIDVCDGCIMYVEQMHTTVATVGRVTEEDLPPETRERLLTAFREWTRCSRQVPRVHGSSVVSGFDWPLPYGQPSAWVEASPDPCRRSMTRASRAASSLRRGSPIDTRPALMG